MEKKFCDIAELAHEAYVAKTKGCLVNFLNKKQFDFKH
jgi:hypothetical protein